MTEAIESVAASRPPKQWLAALLNLLLPGVGHQYVGRNGTALGLLLLSPAVELPLLLSMAVLPMAGVNVAAALGLWLTYRLAVAYWAAREAARSSAGLVGRTSRWYALIATLLVIGPILHRPWAQLVRTTFVSSYALPAGSMETTLLKGDHFMAINWAYGWRIPLVPRVFGPRAAERGDLVVFPFPEDPSRPFLKRVIGLPGETVEIRRKAVYVDGRRLEEPYARFMEPPGRGDQGPGSDWGPQLVPQGALFVLGDNRDNSRDSRFWGYVKQSDLVGRAAIVYWSRDPATGAVRWHRVGRRLE